MIEKKPELEEEYGIKFLARLACLIEGVNIAWDKSELLGVNPETNNNWIKPLAFQKYIDEREKDLTHSIIDYCSKNEIYPGIPLRSDL